MLATLKLASRSLDNGGANSDAGIFQSLGRILISLLGTRPCLLKRPMASYIFAHDCFTVDGRWMNSGRASSQQSVPRPPPGHPEHSYHALVAGAIGGYLVWGRYSGVNYQIVLYLTSRVLVGLGKHLQETYLPFHRRVEFHQSYPLFAAAVWGLVMILFEERPDVLHPSLKKSMDEIYRYRIRPRTGGEVPTTTTLTGKVE